ncbi:MAG: protein PhnA [Flavobacteriaceae bacterium]|jgi:protein PhnA|uniref:PhnA domain-containing protein n=1 Tax=Candidatus Marifrigoribacter sp. Uisw_064 TaxID=3230970 RepID=UPI003ADFC12E
MSFEREVKKRAGEKCEFCGHNEHLEMYVVPKTPEYIDEVDTAILGCKTCVSQFDDEENRDANHWRCLNDSMWSSTAPVQIMSWRMLHRLKTFGWSQDLLDMMYLDEQQLEWAAAEGDAEDKTDAIVHRDANGVVLQTGDSVVLIKDLKVKGSSLVAKQGTAVRRISLDHENEKFIEGKVGPTQIVIITDYVKKL